MSLGKKIEKARVRKDYSQKELAYYLNVDRSTISSWEISRTRPDFQMLLSLCEVLELPITYFVPNSVGDV